MEEPVQTISAESALPPGWEAVMSEKDQRIYYWNKKTGDATWKFPKEAAREHQSKIRRHTYENIKKPHDKPIPPALHTVLDEGGAPASGPSSPKVGMPQSPSLRKPYENVVLSEAQKPTALYEEIEASSSMKHSVNPLYGRGRVGSVGSSLSDPLSPVFSDTDILSPPPDLPDRRYTPPPELCKSPNKELASRKVSSSSLQEPPMHEVSDMGSEYAIVSQKHVMKKHQMREKHVEEEEEGETPQQEPAEPLGVCPQTSSVPQQPPPTLPLRARERMSREKISAARGVTYAEVGVASPKETSIVSDQVPVSAPKQAYQPPSQQPSIAYSVVKLDPINKKLAVMEEDPSHIPLPVSPQPYEVASPTTSCSNLHGGEQFPNTTLPTSPENPHYEEIERSEECGVPKPCKTGNRPRGFSSPVALEHTINQGESPDDSTHSHTPSSEGEVMSIYDLPINSRKLQSLNVTLRRNTPQTEYAKLSLSREALLLRSGVTLRRGRESLSSLSSYISRTEGEGTGGNSGPGTSDEDDSNEPIDKCIKGLESSLKKAGDDFKLVLPQQPSSPSWMNFKRRPHAYEEIMGASQEQLDWDESDLGRLGGTHLEEEDPERCEMVKVEESPVREPKVRVVNHQYEDVALREDAGEGAGLPKGWQLMQDEQERKYYWHIPSGQTQYSPPTGTPKKLSSVEGQHSSSPSMPPQHGSSAAQTFPARYLGWMPIAENQLVTGQCVKAVHSCLSKMAKSQEGRENKGEEVLLQVKGMELQWLKADSVMAAQQINRIRVWGIGLENEKDFGYVSRDLKTRKHRCHIFRCGVPARAIAHVLLEAHQIQRKRLSTSKKTEASPVSNKATPPANGVPHQGGHEHYERFSCVYVGSCLVRTGQGMEMLNEAVERLSVDQRQWQDVCVDVAPSSITIAKKAGGMIKEHRIRYLSFLGIARDDRFCGYILDSGERGGEKCFRFYGFRMEPNTDRLCLSLHAACQARYKRVQEASARQQSQQQQSVARQEVSGEGKTGSSLRGKFSSQKKRQSSVETKTFAVQYLGQQAVVKVDGLDTVRPVVQELAMHPKPNCPHGVEFEVSPAGLAISEKSSRKEFPVKSITYVVKIRNYFAFVAREKSKYFCHAFMESGVDTNTIVTTIQSMLTPTK